MKKIAIIGDPIEFFSERAIAEMRDEIEGLSQQDNVVLYIASTPSTSASTLAMTLFEKRGHKVVEISPSRDESGSRAYIGMLIEIVNAVDELYVYRSVDFFKAGNEHAAALFAKRIDREGDNLFLRKVTFGGERDD